LLDQSGGKSSTSFPVTADIRTRNGTKGTLRQIPASGSGRRSMEKAVLGGLEPKLPGVRERMLGFGSRYPMIKASIKELQGRGK